tara:strand:+ start:270 stop:443 length:174 start_codon:yes stop_codon:yes gene_type:complete
MSSKQIGFLLIVSAFIVAALIVYFKLECYKNMSNFSEKCSDDTDCASGLSCKESVCQ